jgi:micrococcal nuclease
MAGRVYDATGGLQSRQKGRVGAAVRVGATVLAALAAAFLLSGGTARSATPGASPDPAPADAAQVGLAALAQGGSAKVAKIIDGDTLALEDGRVVRLLGIAAPKPPLDRAAGRPWPPAEAARAALAELAQDETVALAFDGRRNDRYGRLLAHLTRVRDGLWLQGELLLRGMARVTTNAEQRALAAPMLEREAAARDAKRGLWASRSYAVRRPEEARFHSESFELIEGKAVATGRLGGRVTIRLGEPESEARDSLTIALLPESRRLFREAGIDPQSLVGKELRVRGFIRWWGGPLIEVTHPEQIEVLGK